MTVSYEHAKHEYRGLVHESASNNTAAGSADMLTTDKLPVGTRVEVLDCFRDNYELDCIVRRCDDYGVKHRDFVHYKPEGTVVGTSYQPRFTGDKTPKQSTSRVLIHFTDKKGEYHIVCDVHLGHLSTQYTKPMAPKEGCRVFTRQDNKLELEPFEFGKIITVIPDNQTDDSQTSVIIESCVDGRQRSVTIGKDVVVVD